MRVGSGNLHSLSSRFPCQESDSLHLFARFLLCSLIPLDGDRAGAVRGVSVKHKHWQLAAQTTLPNPHAVGYSRSVHDCVALSSATPWACDPSLRRRGVLGKAKARMSWRKASSMTSLRTTTVRAVGHLHTELVLSGDYVPSLGPDQFVEGRLLVMGWVKIVDLAGKNARVLGVYGGPRRGRNSRLHPEARKGRQAIGSDESMAISSHRMVAQTVGPR